MSTDTETFKYWMHGGSFTGTFQLSITEIERGYSLGTFTNKDGTVFVGKYWEGKMFDGKIVEKKMAEGSLTDSDGTRKFLGKFVHNKPSDGLFVYSDGRNSARVIPYD
uniref:Uncharacterized protein n=1 Tax=viral metagenome TaxID=1070528 RepID=A0A6C0K432_9ZZZZ